MGQIMNEHDNGKQPISDLGGWLISLGVPESITELMPSEITGLDIAPLMSMFHGVGFNGVGFDGVGFDGVGLGGVVIKSGVRNAGTAVQSADEIKWLPIIRS